MNLVSVDVTVTKSGNSYSLTYSDEGTPTQVVFSVEENGNIKWIDEYHNTVIGSEFTLLEKQV